MAIRGVEKHKENPFLESAIAEVQKSTVKKYRNSAGHSEKAVLQAVDEETGLIKGHTTFVRQIEVDESQFTKVYLSQLSSFFDLSKPAIRVFAYVISNTQISKDKFYLSMNDCLEFTGYSQSNMVYKGVKNLIEAGIIAAHKDDNWYFINPLVMFNGNRISYVKSYVKKKNPKNPNQINMFDGKDAL